MRFRFRKDRPMPPIDTIDLAYGIPLIVVVPAIVQIAKANGLPDRLAGPGAIAIATVLVALGDMALATSTSPLGPRLAGWLIGGIVYGLAAAGFYSLAPSGPGAILRGGDRPGSTPHRSDR
jgi:hypothetical protein